MNVVAVDMHNLLAFPDESRVWIYQADRPVNESLVGKVNGLVDQFAEQWTSHSHDVNATGGLLHDRFLVLIADETRAGVSGCSIDSSVAFVRQLGEFCMVDFMDRQHFAYLENDEVKTVHMHALADLYGSGQVDDSTMFFDNLVKNKGDFVSSWVKPLGESWMKRFA